MTSKYAVLNITSKFSSNDCFKFEFKVEKFSNIRNVTSSQLTTSHKCETGWRVILETTQVNGVNTRASLSEAKMRVGLRRTDSNNCDVEALFFFKVLNSSGHLYFKESVEKIFSRRNAEFFCDYVKRPGKIAQVMGLRRIEFALPDDKLTVEGFVFLHNCCLKQKNSAKHKTPTNHSINLTEMHCNFFQMYLNHSFTDVEFCFGKSKIHAHKAILSSRSPVFKRMFEKDMIENRLNMVQITDIEKHVFDDFLVFLYTGVVERQDYDTVLSLYQVADKYEVKTLFKTCSDMLNTYISAETAAAILKYADMHNDESLKVNALHYIIHNFTTVEETSDWSTLIDADPVFASSILLSISLDVAAKNAKKN